MTFFAMRFYVVGRLTRVAGGRVCAYVRWYMRVRECDIVLQASRRRDAPPPLTPEPDTPYVILAVDGAFSPRRILLR
ncbi:hypothetical protein J6590_033032 [Homalodisca vitripennis]|nr:hypothetical protein J6590_033032 [Homalodisca vitripennis]